LETTGLADPGIVSHWIMFIVPLIALHTFVGPIASIFWMDEAIQSSVYLDGKFHDILLIVLNLPAIGIITVVDAKYILEQLSVQKQDGSINEATRYVNYVIKNALSCIHFPSTTGK
jgi:hypothetical protein